ncbi:MAG: hypothetical protein JWM19_1440 [Actinomycetia bacterium]|nr:hypothetical protein [Actinomycetes bacterium]
MARRDRQKKLGRNGNGIGTPLPVAIALLPTPMAGDFDADKAAGPVRPSGGQTADRAAGRDHPPPRRPGLPGRDGQVRARDGLPTFREPSRPRWSRSSVAPVADTLPRDRAFKIDFTASTSLKVTASAANRQLPC